MAKDSDANQTGSGAAPAFRGPRRPEGAPVGPEAVRRAILDAACELFASNGIDRTSLRQIADRANVNASLISRYIGPRDALLAAVLDDLGERIAEEIAVDPTRQHSFDPDSPGVRWARILAQVAVTNDFPPTSSTPHPVQALARGIQATFGIDERSARIRAAHLLASALGWRIFETYLVSNGDFDDVPIDELRDHVSGALQHLATLPVEATPRRDRAARAE